MQMIENALEPEELEKFKKLLQPVEAGNRHERRAEDVLKRALDKATAEVQQSVKSNG